MSGRFVGVAVLAVAGVSGCSTQVRVFVTGPSELEGARITVDGRGVATMRRVESARDDERDSSPPVSVALADFVVPRGTHELRIDKPGYQSISRSVQYEQQGEDYMVIGDDEAVSSPESPASPAGSQGTVSEDRWWRDDLLVKEAILAYVAAADRAPALRQESDLGAAIFELLLLFDSKNDRDSLETLAALGSYYLGEHPGEVYHCLLTRKGEAIRPALERQLRDGANDCRERLGGGSPRCLSAEQLGVEIGIALSRIGEGKPCSIER